MSIVWMNIKKSNTETGNGNNAWDNDTNDDGSILKDDRAIDNSGANTHPKNY